MENKINSAILVRYIAELTTEEENLFIQKCAVEDPEIERQLNLIQDILEKKAKAISKKTDSQLDDFILSILKACNKD